MTFTRCAIDSTNGNTMKPAKPHILSAVHANFFPTV